MTLLPYILSMIKILDKIVWQNVFCFLTFPNIALWALYIKSCGRSSLPLHQCCYFQLNLCVETCLFAQITLILGKGE